MASARTKFLIGGALVLGTAGYLMATSIQDTGMYYLTPTELSTKLEADPSFRNTGVKIGARVVPGSIQRVPGGRPGGRRAHARFPYSTIRSPLPPPQPAADCRGGRSF